MTSKITISTTIEKANLLTNLANELGVKKNEVFERALSYYADIVETSIINKRLSSIKDENANILSEDEFNRKVKW